ncbi:Mavicyanin [Euphorbia peplus]|nr:Mavicyanin [Euphorbia peplus]
MECFFFLALLIALLPPPASTAASHTVGGSAGWAVPTDPSFYEDSVANITFVAGDSLVFKWTSIHNVLEVTSKEEYDKCTITNGILKETSPVKIPLPQNGTFYFICSIGPHCQLGQKVTIKVGNGISTSSPSPPASSPPSPPASSPPISINVFSSFLLFSSFVLHFLTISSQVW